MGGQHGRLAERNFRRRVAPLAFSSGLVSLLGRSDQPRPLGDEPPGAGPAALKAQAASGRPPKLAPRHQARLERSLLRGAQAAGFANDLWTCPRIAQLIAQQFGVRYHPDHVGRLLRALGWSPQRPVRQARKRNEPLIQHWVKADWPRIKRKPAD